MISKAEGVSGDDRNHVILFLGATISDDDTAFSVGIDYEYRLNEFLGIGALAEYTAADPDSWVLAGELFVHVTEGLGLIFATGVELEDGDAEFLFRTGISYEFDLDDGWTIGPEVNVDFVDGDQDLVVGLSVGRTF